ncbi:MAG TPA: DUF6585 family protein [Gemmataceae bacterium]|jgi:hypothetical protein
MTTQLSDSHPEALRGLGEVLEVYKTGLALPVYVAFVLLFMGGCFCAIGVAPLFVAAQGGGGHLPLLKAVIAGIVSFAFGINLLRKNWRKPRLQVFIFRQALACVEKGEVEIIRWEDVDRVLRVDGSRNDPYCLPGDGVYQVVLHRRDGRQFVFNESLSGFRSFSQLVREHTLRYMLPPALRAYEARATIGFGEISVSPEGIHCGRDTLPWDLFEQAEVSKGRLLLYSRNGRKLFARVELAQVPNFHVLLALAEHCHVRDA